MDETYATEVRWLTVPEKILQRLKSDDCGENYISFSRKPAGGNVGVRSKNETFEIVRGEKPGKNVKK